MPSTTGMQGRDGFAMGFRGLRRVSCVADSRSARRPHGEGARQPETARTDFASAKVILSLTKKKLRKNIKRIFPLNQKKEKQRQRNLYTQKFGRLDSVPQALQKQLCTFRGTRHVQ